MEIQTPKLPHLIMTGIGLVMFAIAMMLNHYHPHNQGIADITHSIYKRFGVESSSRSNTPAFAYVSTLPSVRPKPTQKMADPTVTASHPQANPAAALPTMKLAGGQTDPNASQTDQASDDQAPPANQSANSTAKPEQPEQPGNQPS